MKIKPINFLYPLYVILCVVLLWGHSAFTTYTNELLSNGYSELIRIVLIPKNLMLMLMGIMWLLEHYLAARAAKPVMLVTRFVCVVFVVLWSLRGAGVVFTNLRIPGYSTISWFCWAFVGFLIASTVALLWKKKSE